MNYIRHLNAFFQTIKSDDRLTSAHVSLYLALFQYWNYNRFQNPFPILRDNIMQLSKIGSKNTYHKCMKELHLFSYVIYHTSATKYQPVKVSIIRLDIKHQQASFKQLGLFGSLPSPEAEGSGVRRTNNETRPVSILTGTSPKIGTLSVPESVHLIKPNILKTESNRHSQKSEEEKQDSKGNKTLSAGVPNSVHASRSRVVCHPEPVEGYILPAMDQVKDYFIKSNHLSIEAEKFYNHYKSLGWKISNQPIADWQALANKWMLNNRQSEASSLRALAKQSHEGHRDINNEIAYLHQRYNAGHNIMNQITADHFNHLQLQLTPAIKTEAVKQRMQSLIGSNEHSTNKLLQAYQERDINSQYIIKDQPNLVLLAQRIAVINHFNKQLNHDTADEH